MRLTPSTIALIAVCAGYLIAPLGMAAVNVAIPSLALDLNSDASMVGWIPTVYILSNVAFMLPVGKLADIVGRKRVYSCGLALNGIAALFAAFAQSTEAILFWRFLQGFAGAMVFSTGIAIVSSVVPEHKRGTALGIVAACVYIGLTMAPAVGGYLTEYFGWRWVFLFQVPLIMALLIYIFIFLKAEFKQESPSPFDYKGSVLFALFAVFLVLGFSQLPALSGLLLLGLALVSILGFILHQRKSSKPLIRPDLFRNNRVFSYSLASGFCMYASNFAILFLLSLYLQNILGLSAAVSGKVLLSQAVAMALIAPFAGKLADRFQVRIVATLGCMIVFIGFILMNQISMTSQPLYVASALLLIGLGFGLFSTPNNTAIIGAVSNNDVGVASATMNLSRTVGNLFGMSIVNQLLHYFIGNQPLSTEQNPALMQTINYALSMSLVLVACAVLLSAARGKQASVSVQGP